MQDRTHSVVRCDHCNRPLVVRVFERVQVETVMSFEGGTPRKLSDTSISWEDAGGIEEAVCDGCGMPVDSGTVFQLERAMYGTPVPYLTVVQ